MDSKISGYIVGDRSLIEFLGDINRYGEPARKIIWDELLMKFDSLDGSIMGIKSPIEQALFLTIEKIVKRIDKNKNVQATVLDTQHQIKTKSKAYYLDMVLLVLLWNGVCLNFAIECDGHDFHEKTKEQARKDKQRERALMADGYTVIRFTGSEIYQDPYGCAEEVYLLVLNKIKEYGQIKK